MTDARDDSKGTYKYGKKFLKTGAVGNARIAAALCVCYFSKTSDSIPDSIEKAKFVSVLTQGICLAFHIPTGKGSTEINQHISSCLEYVCTKTNMRILNRSGKQLLITNTGNTIFVDLSGIEKKRLDQITLVIEPHEIQSSFNITHAVGNITIRNNDPNSRFFNLKLSDDLLKIGIKNDSGNNTQIMPNTGNNLLKIDTICNNTDSKPTIVTDKPGPIVTEHTENVFREGITIKICFGNGTDTVKLTESEREYKAYLNCPSYIANRNFEKWTCIMDYFLNPDEVIIFTDEGRKELYHGLNNSTQVSEFFKNVSDCIRNGILNQKFKTIINNSIIKEKFSNDALYPVPNSENAYLEKRLIDTLALAVFLSSALIVDGNKHSFKIEASKECYLNLVDEIIERKNTRNQTIYVGNKYREVIDGIENIFGTNICNIRENNAGVIFEIKHEKEKFCIIVWNIRTSKYINLIDMMASVPRNTRDNDGKFSSKEWVHVVMDDVDAEVIAYLKTIENVQTIGCSLHESENVRLFGSPYYEDDRIETLTLVENIFDLAVVAGRKPNSTDNKIKGIIDKEIERLQKNMLLKSEPAKDRFDNIAYSEGSSIETLPTKQCIVARGDALFANSPKSGSGMMDTIIHIDPSMKNFDLISKDNGKLYMVSKPRVRQTSSSKTTCLTLPFDAEKMLEKINELVADNKL